MELYAAGFNAHHQLGPRTGAVPSHPGNLPSFRLVFSADSAPVKIRAALWSATVLEADGQLLHWGFDRFSKTTGPKAIDFGEGICLEGAKLVFGDLGGVLGALNAKGELFILQSQGARLVFRRHGWDEGAFLCAQKGRRIEFVAVAGSDEVCVSTWSGDGGEFALHVFKSFTSFLSGAEPSETYAMPGPLLALQASATSFTVLLAEDRGVCTFGSALHPELLARTPTSSMPAHVPHPVEFLGGIPIRKIVTCEWLGAALSIDQDLYVWGGRRGETDRIAALPDVGEDVRLVDVEGSDILDVTVGMGHIIVLTAAGGIWGCGDNKHGQLGLEKIEEDIEETFLKEWTKIPGIWEEMGEVVSVEAGSWGSWIVLNAGMGRAVEPNNEHS